MALQVILAGYNLDRDLLLEVRALLEAIAAAADPEALERLRNAVRELLARDNWTPETLSAAYARISRDPRSVTELRRIAREEVEKARRSNETIVFGLGHASVAEHAVFNFDLIGLSRLAVEAVERQRLASFTEKSQRYILLEEDWVLPAEIRGTPVEGRYRESVAAQHAFYRSAYERLLPWVLDRHPEMAGEKRYRRTLEGWAKEDARYGLGLSTTTQIGETINARSLEGLIARCRAHALAEVRELGDALHAAVAGLAPSLVKYTDPSAYQREARAALLESVRASLRDSDGASLPDSGPAAGTVRAGALRDEAGGAPSAVQGERPQTTAVRLVATTPDPDLALIAVLLYAGCGGSLDWCQEAARSMTRAAREALVRSHLARLGPHDSVLREYEHIDLVYDLVLSASCFAQLKRHRMSTQTPLPYDPALGVTVPPSFDETGLRGPFEALVRETEAAYGKIVEALGDSDDRSMSAVQAHRADPSKPRRDCDSALPAPASPALEAAAYVLTNAHRRRVLMKLNARELHHVSRLREDAHAQWDIRELATEMVSQARERMPLTLLMAAGKDAFESRRRSVFPVD